MSRDFFNYIPTAIAAVSAYAFYAAITYNLGLYSLFGSQFLGLISIADYLQNSFIAYPFAGAFFLGYLCITYFFARSVLHKKKAVYNILVMMSLFYCGYVYFSTPSIVKNEVILSIKKYPYTISDYVFMTCAFMGGVIIILAPRVEPLKSLSPSICIVIAIAPIFLTAPYSVGVKYAKELILRPSPMVLINNKMMRHSKIIHYLGRGVLFFNYCDRTAELIPWEEIKSIKYDYSNTTELIACENS